MKVVNIQTNPFSSVKLVKKHSQPYRLSAEQRLYTWSTQIMYGYHFSDIMPFFRGVIQLHYIDSVSQKNTDVIIYIFCKYVEWINNFHNYNHKMLV